jgi:hypothetical protein
MAMVVGNAADPDQNVVAGERMSRITFELTVESADSGTPIIFKLRVESPGTASDAEEVENICNCALDALGFPNNVEVTARVVARKPNQQSAP